MTALLIPYPEIDPVLVQLGPFAIRWYALAYIAGLVIGWQIMRRVCQQPPAILSPEKIDDFLLWVALGVILGGRIGYVLFYKPSDFLHDPKQIFLIWEGGMSFHGGLLGVITAIIAYALRNKIGPFMLSDLVAIVVPIGLFFGRIANFINGELWGRASDVPWAMVFPRGPDAAASQPALPGVLRRRRAVRDRQSRGASPTAGAGLASDRRVLRRLRHGAHHRRVLPRARLFPGIHPGHGRLGMGRVLSLPMLLFVAGLISRSPAPRQHDSRGSVTTELGRLIARRIALTGPISVADFMAEALGHPTLGYYRRAQPLGAAGDFTTAPEISQMFGELVGAWLAERWQAMGRPRPVRLVELGPGRGTLMADALRATRNVPGFHAAIDLHLVVPTRDYGGATGGGLSVFARLAMSASSRCRRDHFCWSPTNCSMLPVRQFTAPSAAERTHGRPAADGKSLVFALARDRRRSPPSCPSSRGAEAEIMSRARARRNDQRPRRPRRRLGAADRL